MGVGTIGLIFDIIGASLLFFYGLPNHIPINKTGDGQETMKDLERQLKEKGQLSCLYERYKCRSKLGIGLLILGFLLQIIDDWT